MPEPIKNDAAGAAVEETQTPPRRTRRRQREQGTVDESKVERPNTVAVFQASPTSITATLAKHGVSLDTTLAWGRSEQVAPAAETGREVGVPIFIVGAGRRLLGELLEAQGLHVGSHVTALAAMTRTIRGNWSSLAREGYPEQYWYKKVGDEFASDREADAGGIRWVEILDTADLTVDTLDRLFPRCLVINVVGGWRQSRLLPRRRPATLPDARYLEVRSADIEADPKRIESLVLRFLGEPGVAAAGDAA